ncbi:hypothetical protein VM1G_04177 [Cytospora mali]|uniref:Mannan endo-1,6-alpha-mannosidase n=1 Tax=Cytospora mali TaxID=578113 RepID=A0A194VXW6_CYTMA|nr:hypothetical protein VM1G_04177 [Valsa mali]
MVASKTFGSWIAKMSLLRASMAAAPDKSTYTGYASTAIEKLQTWYNEKEDLWNTTGWWNSANCLTVLGDFSVLDANNTHKMGLEDTMAITFKEAQLTTQAARRMRMRSPSVCQVEFLIPRPPVVSDSTLATRGYSGFIDDYYDDEGWWALAWIRAYDVTGKKDYLNMAESIFADMQGGVNGTCGGGTWWSKDRTYKNAIANELYLSVAASLANRASDADSYLSISEEQWSWFKNSGMINDNNLINDGLTINANGTCTNNGETEWSYNQGVILGGLVELHKATGKSDLLSEAAVIASAAIDALSEDGILHDSCEPNCGGDGSQFKGVFMRNLHYLQLEAPQDEFRTFILDNANSIWANDRNSSNYLGVIWSGPPSAGGSPNASTQSSAIDALIAAMAVV